MILPAFLLASIASTAPETWFHVIGGNASQEGMKADIAAIAEAGISGIQFFHGASYGSADALWPGVTNPIPCLSDKWIDLVKCAETECHKRGLTFKMQNCPGWSMSGGPWVPINKAMRKLVAFEPDQKPAFDADDDYHEIGTVTFPLEDSDDLSVSVPNPSQINHARAYHPCAKLVVRSGDEIVYERAYPQGAWQDDARMTVRIPHGRIYGTNLQFFVESRHYRRITITDAELHATARLDSWEPKAFRCLREFTLCTNAAPVVTKGTKTLVFGHVNAKRKNHPAPPEGTGWECDKMDARGFEANFEGYLGRLLKAGVKIDGTLVDSWECHVPNWTWKMAEEFEKRCGYELRPWLPALFGYVLKSEAETEKFLLDWRNVCSRLIEENYFGTIARLAREHGMTSQYDTAFGDVLPGDLMRFWKFADEPMCEFWHPHNNNIGYVGSHDFKPVLPCVSAAHLYGKRRVSAESLTSFTLTFNENFREWKDTIDRHLCRGVTHIVFHTYTHNPIVNGKPPSSSFGSYIGSPFLRLQPWWPYLKDFTAYLAWCGRELERGLPVVDILMYVGDAVGHKPHEKKLLFGNRYKYDYLNPDVLHTALAVEKGRLVVNVPGSGVLVPGSVLEPETRNEKPEMMSYRVLWIPKDTYVSSASAAKIAALEKSGARVIRGDFTPDWPSPLAALGRDTREFDKENGLEGWYQRRDGDEEIFFLMEKDDTTRFVYVKDGKIAKTVDPVTGREITAGIPVLRSSSAAAKDGEITLVETESRRDPPWATHRKYRYSFTRPGGDAAETRYDLDLGEVFDWATVWVNGREAARLWCKPYACDISPYVKDGQNEVRVEVTSTIRNLLSHEAGLPYAERTTWTTCGPGTGSVSPAGLKGPVRLMVSTAK